MMRCHAMHSKGQPFTLGSNAYSRFAVTYFLLLCSPASILTRSTIQTSAQRCALYFSPLFLLQDVTTVVVGGWVNGARAGSLFAPRICSPLSIYSHSVSSVHYHHPHQRLISLLSLSFVPFSLSLSLMSVIPGDRTQKKEIGHWIMDGP